MSWAAKYAAQGGSNAVATAIAFAKAQIGKPYQFGAAGPDAYDCSGLVYAAYAAAGIHIARTTYQWQQDGPVIPLSQIQPGDLLFSAGSDGTPTNPGHVVMYLGGGQVIQAPQTGEDVQIDPADLASVVVATRPADLATNAMTTSPSPGGILMTSTHPVPPLPQPQPPAAAAQALADAACAAARAWAQPLNPARHKRAVSQLYSALRDLGIAARGLAVWQAPGMPPGTCVPGVRAACDRRAHAGSLTRGTALTACWPSRGSGRCPTPTSLAPPCATQRATSSWPGGSPRAPAPTATPPSGSFITATGFLSAATLGLATYAPRRRAIDLQAALASLAEATADLSAAIEEPAADPARDDGTGQPLPGSRWPDAGEVS